jgi:ubiquinone/menaquinone biosynthesis C-methylase UbiE
LGINSNKHLLFDRIAPIYGLFYEYQKRRYREVLDRVQNKLNFSAYKNIIDVGCGTGALCSVLHQRGFVVTGIDPVQKMLSIAAKKQENKLIEFIQANILETLPFEDKSFDVSIASYVAHGLKWYERKVMYNEMSRISKHLVIIYDFNEKRSAFINIIEWLERGDYFNFIRNVKSEVAEHFRDTRVIDVDSQAAWYICAVDDHQGAQ